MKLKAFVLASLILIAGLTIFSQVKKTAAKFDEFSDFPAEKVSTLYDRAARFAKRMKLEPLSSKAAIIYYNPRKGKFPLEGGKDWGERAANYLKYSFELAEDRTTLIDGGFREYPTVEFWVVPKGAEMPRSTPTVDKSEIVYCPEIRVAGDGFSHDRKQPLKFSVAIKGAGTTASLPLEWSVSDGKIIDGQGTNQIQIDLSETDAKKITAAVIVKNLPPECDSHAYHTTEIGMFPYVFDQFGHIPYSDIAARIDGFFVQLSYEPTMTGYIIIYGSRMGEKRDVARVMRNIRQFIEFRRFDPSRIVLVDGGLREEMFVEVYLLPPGVEPPKPTPTLNSDFIEEPKKKTTKKRKRSK